MKIPKLDSKKWELIFEKKLPSIENFELRFKNKQNDRIVRIFLNSKNDVNAIHFLDSRFNGYGISIRNRKEIWLFAVTGSWPIDYICIVSKESR